ncbi:MAG: SIMPL domain-containing protein [Chloroflexi bacterium]|nr:SIMPL domain-containing protein [Chloroflexota bacterium]MBA3626373.1 SIMPL domain-containing protein [Chloroflexota bacterium]
MALSSEPQRVITVRGLGRVRRSPDEATLSVSVERTAPTAAEAQAGTSQQMREVIAALSGRGIDASDLSTEAISLEPTFDYRESGARLTGYRASQTLRLRLRRLHELGPTIDTAVAAGATGISGVSLSVSDTRSAEEEARGLAVADARHRAEGLATSAGVRLGSLVGLSEGSVDDGPRPMMRLRAEAMASDTPIAEGSTEVVVAVQASFAIED